MAIPARNLESYRKQLIKLIHVAKRSLALSDDDYRAMLQAQTRKTSCSNMGVSELEKVVEHLRSLGFEAAPGSNPPAKKPAKLAADPQSKMIRHLWLRLRDLGQLRDNSESALAKFVFRQTKVERLEWLNGYQAGQVIESMKLWVERVEKKQEEDGLL